MRYAMRYTVERTFEFEAASLAEAEKTAQTATATSGWRLLSVSPADDPRPMPGPGRWKELPAPGLKV